MEQTATKQMEQTAQRTAARADWHERWRALASLEAILGMGVPLDVPLATAAAGPSALALGTDGRPLALLAPPRIDTFALEDALAARHGPWEGSMAELLEREYGTHAAAAARCL